MSFSVVGISSNSYVAQISGVAIGYESPTVANRANVSGEMQTLYFAPYFTPAPSPKSATPLQVRRALNQLGLRSSVESAVATASQDARDAWDYASIINRDDPILNAMASALGLDSGKLDSLFKLAVTFQ